MSGELPLAFGTVINTLNSGGDLWGTYHISTELYSNVETSFLSLEHIGKVLIKAKEDLYGVDSGSDRITTGKISLSRRSIVMTIISTFSIVKKTSTIGISLFTVSALTVILLISSLILEKS